jgi:hypothetical protein
MCECGFGTLIPVAIAIVIYSVICARG